MNIKKFFILFIVLSCILGLLSCAEAKYTYTIDGVTYSQNGNFGKWTDNQQTEGFITGYDIDVFDDNGDCIGAADIIRHSDIKHSNSAQAKNWKYKCITDNVSDNNVTPLIDTNNSTIIDNNTIISDEVNKTNNTIIDKDINKTNNTNEIILNSSIIVNEKYVVDKNILNTLNTTALHCQKVCLTYTSNTTKTHFCEDNLSDKYIPMQKTGSPITTISLVALALILLGVYCYKIKNE